MIHATVHVSNASKGARAGHHYYAFAPIRTGQIAEAVLAASAEAATSTAQPPDAGPGVKVSGRYLCFARALQSRLAALDFYGLPIIPGTYRHKGAFADSYLDYHLEFYSSRKTPEDSVRVRWIYRVIEDKSEYRTYRLSPVCGRCSLVDLEARLPEYAVTSALAAAV